MARRICVAALLTLTALPAHAANLDVTASYKMRAVSYQNLNLEGSKDFQFNHSFIANDARLGVAVRRISLERKGSEDMSMDVGVTLRALGVTGSSTALQSPFDRVAANYPSSDFTPFLENAYIKINRFLGYPIETTFGRQTYRLGSGLLLDDDGAGLTGVTVRGDLPWWGMKTEAFVFADRNSQRLDDPNMNPQTSLALFGFSVDLPSEGVWQLNQLFERERGNFPIYGCSFVDANTNQTLPCVVNKALRSFTSIHYNLSYGPIVFDGEAAMQKGSASPTTVTDSTYAGGVKPKVGNHITYNGNAQVVKAKWKQSLPRLGEGIARMSVARGSGDDLGTPTTDEAFFPSHGHQYSGLERSGFGEFFAATPYSANGISTGAVSGLRPGNSGIIVVGAGFTPPAYKGYILDIDYYLFQAERTTAGKRTLGTEWDVRLRYNVQDRFGISLTAAFFSAGTASNANGAKARKYALEAFGRF
ncbi:MAG: hypothetical protein PHF00_13020 [Elusimicrobia bacterium]|nr:hypothetical protein [Elusimicrobiota bacterium]